MSDQRNENPEQGQESRYTPRPAWQVWGARAALVLFILFVIYQLLAIATGGLAQFITPLCKREIILERDLLLKGLNIIYKKNKR